MNPRQTVSEQDSTDLPLQEVNLAVVSPSPFADYEELEGRNSTESFESDSERASPTISPDYEELEGRSSTETFTRDLERASTPSSSSSEETLVPSTIHTTTPLHPTSINAYTHPNRSDDRSCWRAIKAHLQAFANSPFGFLLILLVGASLLVIAIFSLPRALGVRSDAEREVERLSAFSVECEGKGGLVEEFFLGGEKGGICKIGGDAIHTGTG